MAVNNFLASQLYNPISDVTKSPAEAYLTERVGVVADAGRSTTGFTIADYNDATNNLEADDVIIIPVSVVDSGVTYSYFEFARVASVSSVGVVVLEDTYPSLTGVDTLPNLPPCGAIINKVLEGIRTEGGIDASITPEVGELFSDQSGTSAIDSVLDGVTASITLPRTSFVVQTYQTSFPMFDVIDSSMVLGNRGLGYSFNPNNLGRKQADILLLVIGARPSRTIGQVMFYNIGLAEGSDLSVNFSKENQLVQEITFASYGEPGNVKRVGDNLLLFNGDRVSFHTQPPSDGVDIAISVPGCA